MRKIHLIIYSFILLLTACMGSTVKTELSIEKTVYRPNDTSWFSFYIERPDLKLSEKDFADKELLSIDLPKQLQSKYIYISSLDNKDPESGTLCDSQRFPHTCDVDFSDKEYLVKITFLDSSVSITQIEVPKPEEIAKPEIVSPKEKPAQNSNFEMSFKDVGADAYQVSIANCDEYKNDGINPCLDDSKYEISIENGVAKITNDSAYLPTVELRDGLINLKSNFVINFEDGVRYYITAIKSTVKMYTENYDSLSYYKE